jgi:hypothetical protein
MYYRGYILIRLKIIGTQWNIVEKINSFNRNNSTEEWRITYVTPTYGGWDLIIECLFSNLNDLDSIITYCRTDPDLTQWIEATTTMISVKKDFELN